MSIGKQVGGVRKRKEELHNEYEDARLALLMDEFCEEEGAKLLAESDALNGAPDASVPADLHQRLQNTVDRHFAEEKRGERKLAVRRDFRRSLIAAAIAAALFATAFATVEDFRVAVMNMTLDVQEKYSNLIITLDPPEKSDYASNLEVSLVPGANFVFGDEKYAVWIPEGNEILKDECDENGVFVYLKSKVDDSSMQLQASYVVENMTFQVDTENADEIVDIEINGHPGYYIRKGDWKHFLWIDSEQNLILQVLTEGYPVETSLAIAESWSIIDD